MKQDLTIMTLEEHLAEARKLFINKDTDTQEDTFLKSNMNLYFDSILEYASSDDMGMIDEEYLNVMQFINIRESYETLKPYLSHFSFEFTTEEPNGNDIVSLAGEYGKPSLITLDSIDDSYYIHCIASTTGIQLSAIGSYNYPTLAIFWSNSNN